MEDRSRRPRDRGRSSTSMTLNPYTPPNTVSENALNDGDRIRSLSRAATLYRRMGWIGIIYFFVAFPLGLWSGSQDGPLPIGSVVGMTFVTVLFVGLFTSMIRLAPRLQSELATVYNRARWTGLLAGAFGFPILTIPAFYAVRLIGRGHLAEPSDEP